MWSSVCSDKFRNDCLCKLMFYRILCMNVSMRFQEIIVARREMLDLKYLRAHRFTHEVESHKALSSDRRILHCPLRDH